MKGRIERVLLFISDADRLPSYFRLVKIKVQAVGSARTVNVPVFFDNIAYDSMLMAIGSSINAGQSAGRVVCVRQTP